MNLFFSAGEASGDVHAAGLIKALKHREPALDITFLGGDKMGAAAGCQPLIHYSRMAFMGFTEVARNLPAIFRNLATTKNHITHAKPDAVVLVDYPGFNMKIARHARSLGIPVFYYIAPKVWAWKQWRVKSLKRDVTKILSILPFEPQWFASRGAEAVYVGNPSVEEMMQRLSEPVVRQPDLLALIPGSRQAEIKSNLPVMVEAAKRVPHLKPVIASAPSIPSHVYSQITNLPLATVPASHLMKMAAAAMVTSGTAVLECALARTPQVALYRSNGMKIAFDIMKHVVHLPFVTLPNLIAQEQIVPELLVHHCNPAEVGDALQQVLANPQAQLKDYDRVAQLLHTSYPASETAAQVILDALNKQA